MCRSPRLLLPLALMVATLLPAPAAFARQDGIVGLSGKASGQNCTQCHTNTTFSTRVLLTVGVENNGTPVTGPLMPNTRYTLRLRTVWDEVLSASGVNGGFNLATGTEALPHTAGILHTNTGDSFVRIQENEATHTMRKPFQDGPGNKPVVEWLVDWTTPAPAMGTGTQAARIFASARRVTLPASAGGTIRSLSANSGMPIGSNPECGPGSPAACGIDVQVQRTTCADADGDGYLEKNCAMTNNILVENFGGDCNDDNPAVNPGALDVCNGVDDDCNGQMDEGLTGTAYYPDVDNDTFGSAAAAAVMACSPERATALGVMRPVTNRSDCDDMNANIKPGVMEVCDGVDNNCAGGVDDGLPTMAYYPDMDNDTFGSAAATAVQACSQPQAVAKGAVRARLDNSDCDDARADVKPGGFEVCDGADNDCLGGVDNGLATSAFYPDQDGDGYGNRTASASMACDRDQAEANGTVNATPDNTDCNDTIMSIHPDATEVCDGVDQNCDGADDEIFTFAGIPLGQACDSLEDSDQCARGMVVCNNEETAAICAGDVASAEICDGMQNDDNCDGQPDQAVFTDLGQTCGVVGTCNEGRRECAPDGQGTECRLLTGGREICGNGRDDDCDGMEDEVSDITYGDLGYNDFCDSPDDPDQCANGLVKCVNMFGGCVGDFPTPELCNNGVDDDCDDETDEFPCTVPGTDAGPPPDATMPDAAMPDAAMPDAAMPDAAMGEDASAPDAAGEEDAGVEPADGGAGWGDVDAGKTGGEDEVVCACSTTRGEPAGAVLLTALLLVLRRRVRRP